MTGLFDEVVTRVDRVVSAHMTMESVREIPKRSSISIDEVG